MKERWETVKRWTWRTLKTALLIAAVGGVAYWVRFSPITVVERRAESGEIVAEVMGTGTLEARIKASVGPKISGRIAEVLVDQGDRVTAGSLLVRLDGEELRQQVAIAEANLEAARAAIVRLEADKERAIAVSEQARLHHGRLVSAKKAVSQQDVDKAVESLAVADAGLSRTEAAIAEGHKEVIAAEKNLEYHRARLADTEITAPFDGLIVRRQRDPGDVVVPGSAILTLISTNELWISAWVDETEMAKLKAGQRARVVFRSEPDRAYPGTVVRLGREADRETREFVVDVRVLELPKNWAVGQRAEAYIETARKDSVTLLPAEFIVWREDRPGVHVSVDARAVWRPLKIGLRGREMVEVAQGLAPGEIVVVSEDRRASLSQGRRITSR